MTVNDEVDIANARDARCSVTVNGEAFLTNTVQNESDVNLSMVLVCRTSFNEADHLLIGLQRKLKAAKIKIKSSLLTVINKKFSKCGRCEGVVYCDKECQKADWEKHKTLCTPKMRRFEIKSDYV
jgi:hypothetical protein